MKKIISIITVLILLLSVLSINYCVSANTSGTISLGNVAKAAGSEIEIPVVYKGNPGFAAAGINIAYNKDVLEVIGAENGSMKGFQVTENNSAGEYGATLLVTGTKDIKGDGILFILKMKIKDTAKAGKYELTLTSKYGVCNYNEEMLSPTLTSGSVTVPCTSHNFEDGNVCKVCGAKKEDDGKVIFEGANEDGTAEETNLYNANSSEESIIDNQTEEEAESGLNSETDVSDEDGVSETEAQSKSTVIIVFCIIGAVILVAAVIVCFVVIKKRKIEK